LLKIIDFIHKNNDWQNTLTSPPYSITISEDDGFTMLKYSQYDSDFTIELVRECRGIILDMNYNAVCVPFFKFANYGESYAAEIDWSTAIVEEKIDGSLIKIWNYDGQWKVSTNGTIYADKAFIGSQFDITSNRQFCSYGELFNNAAEVFGLNMSSLNPDYTYMFELCSPYTRIVVPHKEIKLYHIGTKSNITYNELDIDIGIQKPKTFRCNNLDDLIEMASKLKYCDEGYVVKDEKYNRIKIKSPSYVAVHHLISDLSDKRLLELIRNNETSEFLVYFPEYKHYIDVLNSKISIFCDYINSILNDKIRNRTYETRKEFAAFVCTTKHPAFFFNYYDNKVSSPIEWLWNFPNDKILQILEK